MTPIRKSERKRYPPNWRAISLRIRHHRARWRRECTGQCGDDHSGEVFLGNGYSAVCVYDPDGARCVACEHQLHPLTGSRVVLTVAHLDHVPENCNDGNLLAMCQRCHNRYDAEHRAETRRAT